MPFDQKRVLRAQAAAVAQDQAEAQAAVEEPSAAAPSQAPEPQPERSEGASRPSFRRFGKNAAPRPAPQTVVEHKSPPRPEPPPAVLAEQRAQPAAAPKNQRMGYAGRVSPVHEPSRPGLSARVEAYIDQLALFRNWSKEEIEHRKEAATQNIERAERDYRKEYDEVLESRRAALLSIEEGVRQNPDHVLFAVKRGAQSQYKKLPRGQAGPYGLFHGSVFDSRPASGTLFPAPEKLFSAVAPAEETSPEPEKEEGSARSRPRP